MYKNAVGMHHSGGRALFRQQERIPTARSLDKRIERDVEARVKRDTIASAKRMIANDPTFPAKANAMKAENEADLNRKYPERKRLIAKAKQRAAKKKVATNPKKSRLTHVERLARWKATPKASRKNPN